MARSSFLQIHTYPNPPPPKKKSNVQIIKPKKFGRPCSSQEPSQDRLRKQWTKKVNNRTSPENKTTEIFQFDRSVDSFYFTTPVVTRLPPEYNLSEPPYPVIYWHYTLIAHWSFALWEIKSPCKHDHFLPVLYACAQPYHPISNFALIWAIWLWTGERHWTARN